MIARSLHNGCDERRGGPIATGAVHQQHFWSWVFREIVGGEFDVVLRVVPITAVLPSPFAFFLRKGRVDLL
jgi:hypothetical protein